MQKLSPTTLTKLLTGKTCQKLLRKLWNFSMLPHPPPPPPNRFSNAVVDKATSTSAAESSTTPSWLPQPEEEEKHKSNMNPYFCNIDSSLQCHLHQANSAVVWQGIQVILGPEIKKMATSTSEMILKQHVKALCWLNLNPIMQRAVSSVLWY